MLDSFTPQLTLWSADDTLESWQLRESPRARRLSVRVFRTGRVEVVVPRRTPQRTITLFLERHRAWIERKRAESRSRIPPAQAFPPDIIEFAACDQRWRLHLAGGKSRAKLKIIAPGLLSLSGNPQNVPALRQALRRWLMTQAQAALAPLLAATARELGFKYSKLVIRRQRTRWGSCSTRGTISLNCTLLFLKPQVVRYLLIHELAHTRHMNHSRRFWACVEQCCPDYARLDRELRDGWRQVPAWVFDS